MYFKRDLSFLLIAHLGFSTPGHAQHTDDDGYYINYETYEVPKQDREGYFIGHLREDPFKDPDGYYIYTEIDQKKTNEEDDFAILISDPDLDFNGYYIPDEIISIKDDNGEANHNYEIQIKKEIEQIPHFTDQINLPSVGEEVHEEKDKQEKDLKIEIENYVAEEKAFQEEQQRLAEENIEEEAPKDNVESYYPGIKNSSAALKEIKQPVLESKVSEQFYRDISKASPSQEINQQVATLEQVTKPEENQSTVNAKAYYYDISNATPDEKQAAVSSKPASTFTTVVTAAVVGGGVSAAVFSVLFKDQKHHSSRSSSLNSPSYYDPSETVSDSCSTCGTRKKWEKPSVTINFTSSMMGVTPFVRTPEGQIFTNGEFDDKHDAISIIINDTEDGEYFAGFFAPQMMANSPIKVKAEVIHSKEGQIAILPIAGMTTPGNRELGSSFRIE